MLPIEDVGVLLIIRLVELVLGRNTMTMHAVASRRSTARTVLAMVVLLELIGARSGRRSLNIAQMGVHRHALSNLGDALVIHIGLALSRGEGGTGLLL